MHGTEEKKSEKTNMRTGAAPANLYGRILDIYGTYVCVIAPFIVQLEVLDGEFPVEILNEIRAMFTHISRCYLKEDPEKAEDNITKAERHVKRAILDCHKHLCITYDEQYREFKREYRGVDLSVVNDGKFLTNLTWKREAAVEKLQKAKRREVVDGDGKEVYDLYNEAYNAYSDVYNLIRKFFKELENARGHARMRNVFAVVTFIVSFIIGMVGIGLTVYSMFICGA